MNLGILRHQFNVVSLDIPLGNGWRIAEAARHKEGKGRTVIMSLERDRGFTQPMLPIQLFFSLKENRFTVDSPPVYVTDDKVAEIGTKTRRAFGL